MVNDDVFKTIVAPSEGTYSEKRSKFLSFAYPVQTKEEVKELIDELRKQYYDSRHVCYAYMLGFDGTDFRANDDGEPSSTAGRPILGQIRSNELTNVLVAVVRYFGGIELGTGGLIVAYKAAAAEALAAAEIVEKTIDEEVYIGFEYPFMNDVMRVVKEDEPQILEQDFYLDCKMKLRIRKSMIKALKEKLSKVETLVFLDAEGNPEATE